MFFGSVHGVAAICVRFGVRTNKDVIPSERSESRDLGTDWTANVIQVRRSLDSTSFRSG